MNEERTEAEITEWCRLNPDTWGAFKAEMDAAGVEDSDKIGFLDFSGCPLQGVKRGKDDNGKWWVNAY